MAAGLRTVRCVLMGLGNLGWRFCEVLERKASLLREQYGLQVVMVGVADSKGAAYSAEGLDLATIVQIKRNGGSIGTYPGVGTPGRTALDLVEHAEADLLFDASPVNWEKGAEPGLSCIRAALTRGMHVVTPNKGPIVLAYRELKALAAEHGVKLRFDGTVAGGLPVLYLGQRDLRGAVISRMEAVPNLVTGFVMDLLASGASWEAAMARGYQEGVLEGDGAWDLEGYDATAKLVILANAVLNYPARMEDVERHGIVGIDPEELRAVRDAGKRMRLVVRAELRPEGGYALSVAPTALAPEHPLGRLGQKQMGIVYTTDIYGTVTAIIDEPDPIPSSATMLRDFLDIYVEVDSSR